MPDVHHVAEVVLEVADGEAGGPLQLAAVTVDHRQEATVRQVVDLQQSQC